MIVFVHDWGSYFVVEVLWNYCILALPELFPSSVLSSSGAAAKLWCEQLHLGQGSALVGTYLEEICSRAQQRCFPSPRPVAGNSLPLP